MDESSAEAQAAQRGPAPPTPPTAPPWSLRAGLDGEQELLDDRVRALLAEAAPLAMPREVEDHILRALLRERSGPRAVPGPGSGEPPSRARVRRPRRLLGAAAMVAAAALLGVAGSTVHLPTPPARSAAAAMVASPTAAANPASTTDPAGPAGPASAVGPPAGVLRAAASAQDGRTVHIQLSTTAYTASSLPQQVRRLLTTPGTPIQPGAAEAPSLGPIATQIGLDSCLDALGVKAAQAVSVDLATVDGRPAAVIAVARDGAAVAYAVRRSCTTGDPALLLGPTPVP